MGIKGRGENSPEVDLKVVPLGCPGALEMKQSVSQQMMNCQGASMILLASEIQIGGTERPELNSEN